MLRLLVIPLILIALLIGAMTLSGGGAKKRATFAFFNRGDIYTLDLNQMSYMQDFRLTYGIREGLFSPDPKTLRPVPAGAATLPQVTSLFRMRLRCGPLVLTPWATSAERPSSELAQAAKRWLDLREGQTYIFRLRKEARWSNGDPVTAHDYVFSWRLMLQVPGEYTYLFYYIKNAEAYEKAYAEGEPFDLSTLGITAVDDYTFKVELNDPVPYLLELLAFPPFYPRHEKSMEPFKKVMDKGRIAYDAAYTRPPYVVTNGPYVLKTWEFKVRLVLEKSPTYWDREHVLTDRLEMVVNENALSQFLQYEAGEVDWISDVINRDQAAELKAQGRTDLRTSEAFGTAFLTLLCQEKLPPSVSKTGEKNPLADVRVRQALAMSMERSFITEYITRMDELPARTYLPPDGTLPDFRWKAGPFDPAGADRKPYTDVELRNMLRDTKSPAGPGLPYDVKRARQLLADAGYPEGKGFPTLPILYNSDNPLRGKIALALKDQWKQALNIDVTPQQIDGKIFQQQVAKKDYAIATVAWYGDYPDASTFTDKYLSTSLQNDSDWKNPKFDDLCEQAKHEGDPDKRRELLTDAENLIDTEVPIIPMYHYKNISMNRDNVEGVAPNPRNLTIFKGVRVR